jgi:hypothetical protein
MRALLVSALLVTGCGSDTLGEDTAYRRLVDQFSTYEQCVSAGFVGCYQTLTLCQSGRVRMELDPQRMEGKYIVDGDTAIAEFPTMTVTFDLESGSSPQLPGRSWDLVEPVVYDCQ